MGKTESPKRIHKNPKILIIEEFATLIRVKEDLNLSNCIIEERNQQTNIDIEDMEAMP